MKCRSRLVHERRGFPAREGTAEPALVGGHEEGESRTREGSDGSLRVKPATGRRRDPRACAAEGGTVTEQAPRPGWWKASDGKWYPPADASRAPAPGWWLAADGKWYPPADESQAPAPGWWLASDGKWYPPVRDDAASPSAPSPSPAASPEPAAAAPSPPPAAPKAPAGRGSADLPAMAPADLPT